MEEEKEVEVLKEKAPKKKGNGSSVVIIIILLLIIGGLGGFIFANKDNLFSKKDAKEEKEEKKTKKEEKEEEIAIDDSRFITIYNKLKGYTYNQNRENGYKSFTDAELGNIGGTDLVKDDFTILDETTEWGDHFYTFKSDSIIKYLKNYFASDVTFNAEALNNGQTALIVDKVSDNGSGMSIVSYDSSSKTYKVRFAIGNLMRHFLDEDFNPKYPEMVAKVKSEEYYVNMMIAWYFATALAKQYETILPYIVENRLETWTHNKAIQKSVESDRISAEQKEYLKSFKRK